MQALAAETYSNCKRLAEAEQHAAAALHIDPANPDSLFIAAHVDAARNRPDAAIAKIELALTKRPDHLPCAHPKGALPARGGSIWPKRPPIWPATCGNRYPDNMDVISLAVLSRAGWPLTTPFSHICKSQILPATREKAGGVAFADALKLLGKAPSGRGRARRRLHDAFSRAKSAAPMRAR